MSTKTHKPATTSDILSNPQIQESNNPTLPNNPPIHKSANPFSAATRGRCGKVARLPKEIRDQLNEMLLDGVPHHQIIQKLQHNFGTGSADIPVGPQSNVLPLNSTEPDTSSLSPLAGPARSGERAGVRGLSTAPEHDPACASQSDPQNPAQIENQNSKIEILASLTPRHITNWKKFGGYRDWLRDQQRIEECKLRHELTLDLARSAEGLASYQAAPKVAVAQICQTIIDLGPDGLKDAMKDSPLNCFRLLNALARLINSGLKCEQQIQKTATKQRGGMTRARFARIEKNLNLM